MAPPPGGPVDVGDRAPDFSLAGTGGRTYSLREHRGRPVVLVFYPADDSPVCTMQLTSYAAELARFEELGAVVLGVSPQDVASHEAFAERSGGFGFPLLSDADKAVGEAYGILGPLGFYKRSVFVVDGEGVIRYAHRSRTSATFRPTDELIAAVARASATTG